MTGLLRGRGHATHEDPRLLILGAMNPMNRKVSRLTTLTLLVNFLLTAISWKVIWNPNISGTS